MNFLKVRFFNIINTVPPITFCQHRLWEHPTLCPVSLQKSTRTQRKGKNNGSLVCSSLNQFKQHSDMSFHSLTLHLSLSSENNVQHQNKVKQQLTFSHENRRRNYHRTQVTLMEKIKYNTQWTNGYMQKLMMNVCSQI